MSARADDRSSNRSRSIRRWRIVRLLLLIAATSLAVYMPFKAVTSFDRLEYIYGPWFLQGVVVAVAGLIFFWRPAIATRTPLLLRLGVGAAALLWMQTGLACTPSLLESLQASLLKGGFASFHMFAQHVFLSLGVALIMVAPAFFARSLGIAPEGVADETPELSPEANR